MFPHDRENHAPEVVNHSGLIHVPNEMESPEAVQTQYQHLLPQSEAPSYPIRTGTGYSSEKGLWPSDTAVAVGVANTGRTSVPTWRKRRNLIIFGVLGAIVLAVGLGVGLGIGLTQKSSSNVAGSGSNAAVAASTSAATSSSTPSSSGTVTTSTIASASTTTSVATSSSTDSSSVTSATATTSAVTSGSTGVAQFSCTGGDTTTSSDGTQYLQECYTQYPGAGPSFYDDTITMKNLGGKNTVYSVKACLDTCESYNAAGNTPACRAITYYANLSAPIDLYGGNCFLKNDRGIGRNTDAVDWHHTLSAYQSCLNVTCAGSN